MFLSFGLKGNPGSTGSVEKHLKISRPFSLTYVKSNYIHNPLSCGQWLVHFLKVNMLTYVYIFLNITISLSFGMKKYFSPQTSAPDVYMSLKQHARPAWKKTKKIIWIRMENTDLIKATMNNLPLGQMSNREKNPLLLKHSDKVIASDSVLLWSRQRSHMFFFLKSDT